MKYMVFVACGLNHKTAPIAIREKIAPCSESQRNLLQELVSTQPVSEAAILSTCNRTELYCKTQDSELLVPWLADKHRLNAETLKQHTYLHRSDAGLRHTIRVACGLDSKMLGEPQILGQMKQAYQQACDFGTAGPELSHLFRHIFSASKRVRTHTDIGMSPISVAFAAVHLTKTIFKQLSQLQVLLIGTGDTIQSVAQHFQKQGVKRFLIAGRTREKADALAKAYQGQGLCISDISETLGSVDIVVTATACPLPFISKSLIDRTMLSRKEKPMFLLDLAVPRDIEAEVSQCENVFLYNIDDMQDVVDEGLSKRQLAATEAEQIIDIEVEHYKRWQRALGANEAIREFRERMAVLGEIEADRARNLLNNGNAPEMVINELTHRLINKLIHQPTTKLREAAYDGRDDLLELAIHLYQTSEKAVLS